MSAMLVIDVGTTGLRAAIVDDTLRLRAFEYRPCPPTSPAPGLVEFDATDMASKVLDAAHAVLATVDEPVAAVGITNQRASAVVWDRNTGEPIGPGLGWQDLRTIGGLPCQPSDALALKQLLAVSWTDRPKLARRLIVSESVRCGLCHGVPLDLEAYASSQKV